MAVVALTAIFSLFFLLAGVPNASATCSGAACQGQDPQATGCSAGAVDLSDITYYSNYRVQLRYSSVCNAVWARLTVIRAGDCAPWLPDVEVRKYSSSSSSEGSYLYKGVGGPGWSCYDGLVYWTPMSGSFSQYWFRACYNGFVGGLICSSPH
jgi:hypothetical protein